MDSPVTVLSPGAGHYLEIGTGLAYPLKADRARRNSKVGLLLGAHQDGPVVSISAIASVRDADLQANTDYYVKKYFAEMMHGTGAAADVVSRAIWYWARMFVHCYPIRVVVFPNGDLDDGGVTCEFDPPDVSIPPSDPAPMGPTPKSPFRAPAHWPTRAREAMQRVRRPMLTVVDEQGFPLPFPVRTAEITERGFELTLPKSVPWEPTGPASLTFSCTPVDLRIEAACFLGTVERTETGASFTVDRVLPDNPLANLAELWEPQPAIREALMARLIAEVGRREQPVPEVVLNAFAEA